MNSLPNAPLPRSWVFLWYQLVYHATVFVLLSRLATRKIRFFILESGEQL
jgi:hypothetical protein